MASSVGCVPPTTVDMEKVHTVARWKSRWWYTDDGPPVSIRAIADPEVGAWTRGQSDSEDIAWFLLPRHPRRRRARELGSRRQVQTRMARAGCDACDTCRKKEGEANATRSHQWAEHMCNQELNLRRSYRSSLEAMGRPCRQIPGRDSHALAEGRSRVARRLMAAFLQCSAPGQPRRGQAESKGGSGKRRREDAMVVV